MDNEERKSWEQVEGESITWFRRFDRYRLMKWERSIAAVFQEEYSKKLENTRKTLEPDGTWYKAAERYKWLERAAAWDKHRLEERDKQIVAEEAEIIREEYALKHHRIKELNEVAKLLREEVFDEDKRWVDDVKAVGLDAHHLKQFNDGLLKEYREYLSDIADEMGERVKKKEILHKGFPPDTYVGIDPKDIGSKP